MYCCSQFEGLHGDAGLDGLAIFCRTSDAGRVFVMQAKSTGLRPSYEFGIHEVVIRHCPGCGVNLLKWYVKDLESLTRDDLSILFG
jgi:hypothetical protein